MASLTARTATFSGFTRLIRSPRHPNTQVLSITDWNSYHFRASTVQSKPCQHHIHITPPAFRTFSSSAVGDSSGPTENAPASFRLSKFLSLPNTNINISRRQAERLIRAGEVTVAGKIVTSPHFLLTEDNATAVKVGNQHVVLASTNQQRQTRVWLVHKVAGEIVSENDPHGRASLLERLRRGGVGRGKVHLKPIGRLDMSTEGLILVTNDGQYAREMELPSNHVHRVYRVRVHGLLTPHKLKRIRSGLTIENVRYRGMQIQMEGSSRNSTNTWLRITSTEGKNRQIRKVLTFLGLRVLRLIRVAYGDYEIKTIPPGMAIEVPVKPLEQQKRSGPLDTSARMSDSTTKIRLPKGPKKKKGKEGTPDKSPVTEESRNQTVQWIRHDAAR